MFNQDTRRRMMQNATRNVKGAASTLGKSIADKFKNLSQKPAMMDKMKPMVKDKMSRMKMMLPKKQS